MHHQEALAFEKMTNGSSLSRLLTSICHCSFAICHLSFVICHLSFAICHLTEKYRRQVGAVLFGRPSST
ncbi:MAG: hypothetical protein DMG08_17165 [Acidobacteria bacterium]|nr:MAG: hypothetical protein DMG08_17165 [Acidobacteriota bacterium]